MVWVGDNYPQEYPDDCEGQCMCRACTACIAVIEQERDELAAANERLRAHAELLSFCLGQARIVLDHFSKELSDSGDRRIAQGALIASNPPDDEEWGPDSAQQQLERGPR